MSGQGKKDWNEVDLQISPAENLLKNLDNFSIGVSSKNKIRELLNSCRVKKGNNTYFVQKPRLNLLQV